MRNAWIQPRQEVGLHARGVKLDVDGDLCCGSEMSLCLGKAMFRP